MPPSKVPCEAGANLSATTSSSQSGSRTPAYLAAKGGQAKALEALAKAGALQSPFQLKGFAQDFVTRRVREGSFDVAAKNLKESKYLNPVNLKTLKIKGLKPKTLRGFHTERG